jgi:hypothetical protein
MGNMKTVGVRSYAWKPFLASIFFLVEGTGDAHDPLSNGGVRSQGCGHWSAIWSTY